MILVTIPASNESKNLKECVDTILKESFQFGEDFHIIIAEDGSTDGTDRIAQELDNLHSNVTHLHSSRQLGKGLALKRAFNKVEAEIYAFIDCDLATSMKFFPQLINSIKEGNDLALGSRYIKGAKIQRAPLRDISSRLYNMIIRILFRDQLFDHQIGFKAFSNRLIKRILNECDSTGWFWDTEILIRSKKNNFRIFEFPVEWHEKTNGTPHLKMIINVGIQNIYGILRLFFHPIKN
ncbi:glycosyltransferase [Candidatus Bathyarchaeota archaeon]|nr:glycosyltransferase [Candidatus Bathyarchaeota archaeon]